MNEEKCCQSNIKDWASAKSGNQMKITRAVMSEQGSTTEN